MGPKTLDSMTFQKKDTMTFQSRLYDIPKALKPKLRARNTEPLEVRVRGCGVWGLVFVAVHTHSTIPNQLSIGPYAERHESREIGV